MKSLNIDFNQCEIRRILPPRLEPENMAEKVICQRPMRHGSPKLDVTLHRSSKVVAHNYGHGGSGWTLAPACADYVNSRLTDSPYFSIYGSLNRTNTPITIIGGGIIGLFTAYDLIKKNFTSVSVVADNFENTTSHNAGI